ncbi:hypothetical protein PCANC_10061 [Puccinia coronata f. sp. avenae]|uniref:Secreted protein n=1 Tax=Puccinia coronata f. sp. avenae TaxID=200324 RepID=A0A2N5UT25_9BASI|nr:hypothetical protein PCANC_18638 [Puccinia coronata f. sp. avenae]PLW40912.1 hypothetical protein PCASD_10770 [Puccinia coronata f. sp. avenae]PLW43469.1 hypothetical protein PCANC_10061 [Puccinia coronata f. sp. avenae]
MISALIVLTTLASFPIVKAESKQQCAIMYMDRSSGGEVDDAWCTNGNHVQFKCKITSCHGGGPKDTAKTHPMSDFAFTGCTDADDNGNSIGHAPKTVYPYSFQVNRDIHRLDVYGYTAKNTKSTNPPSHYNCNHNTARPWCDRCDPGYS